MMMKQFMADIQKSFDGIFDNLKIPGFRWFMKGWIGAWSRINSMGSQASDGWSHHISTRVMYNDDHRNRLTDGIYLPQEQGEQMYRLENARVIVMKADAAEKKIRKAIREKVLPKKKVHELFEEAKLKNIITDDELKLLRESDQVRYDAILVDDFDEKEYHGKT
jgi:acyl-CoA dehydrogenase